MPTLNEIVDVIIPVYNGQKYILAAIESVVTQSIKPRCIIVIDDGSTDNTAKLVLEYKRITKTKINLYHKKNGGLSSARNFGIKKSNADFVALLDSDDQWNLTKLAKQLFLFRRSTCKNLGLVFCDYEMIDEDGNVDLSIPHSKLDRSARGHIFMKLLDGNKVTSSGSGVLVRREVFKKVGYFDEALPAAEDWDMWLRIAREFDFDYIPEKLVKIRRHQSNMSNSEVRLLIGISMVLNKLVSSGQYSLRFMQNYRMRIIRLSLTNFLDYRQIIDLIRIMSPALKDLVWDNGQLLIGFLKVPLILFKEKIIR